MPTVLTGKYVSLTTFRRDGTPVSTPVWFVADNGNLLVETDANSYKVKRIRRNARVTVAACNASGRLRGEAIPAHVAILSDEELPRTERLLHEKYRLDYIFVLPIYRLAQRLRGKPLRLQATAPSCRLTTPAQRRMLIPIAPSVGLDVHA